MRRTMLLSLFVVGVMSATSTYAAPTVYDPEGMTPYLPIAYQPWDGVTVSGTHNGTTALSPTPKSVSGDMFIGHDFSSNWNYIQIFRADFDDPTDQVAITITGSSAMFYGQATLTAYNSSNVALGTATSTDVMDGSPKQTIGVSYGTASIAYLTMSVSGDGNICLDTFSTGAWMFDAGDSYDGYSGTSDQGRSTVFTLIDGDAGDGRDLSMEFTAGATFDPEIQSTLVSDVVSLTGTETDTFVLQVSYDESVVADYGVNESDLRLLWEDADKEFVNAVLGNSNAVEVGETLFVNGAYLAGTHTLGYYGVDTEANVVWAVLDHNSRYAAGSMLTAVPEPTSFALLIAAGLLTLRRRR